MTLDRKTKDYDASIELLYDRLDEAKKLSLILFTIGLVLLPIAIFLPYKIQIYIVGMSIALFFLSSQIWHNFVMYRTYLFFIRKGLIRAEEEN